MTRYENKQNKNNSPNIILSGKICLAGPNEYSVFGNCVKKLGLGGLLGDWQLSPFSLTLTAVYTGCPAALSRARCPDNPAIQQIITVTMHWNQVVNKGAGIDIPSFDTNTLLRYTMDIDTNQYNPTTDAMYIAGESAIVVDYYLFYGGSLCLRTA